MKGTALTTDRNGNRWKVYANGRMLCARTVPYHYAYDEKNDETDGPCDCDNREGETIGEYVLDGNGIRRVTP